MVCHLISLCSFELVTTRSGYYQLLDLSLRLSSLPYNLFSKPEITEVALSDADDARLSSTRTQKMSMELCSAGPLVGV